MNSKDIINHIHQHPEGYLTRAKKSGFICPKCLSGSGPNGTGLSSKDGGIHFKCFANDCFSHADVIDIIGVMEGISDYPSKLRRAAQIYHLSLDDDYPSGRYIKHAHSTYMSDAHASAGNSPAPIEDAPTQRPLRKDVDYSQSYPKWHEDIDKTQYHRGLTQNTLDRFQIGFCEKWTNPEPKDPNAKQYPSPMLIIPTSKFSYLARDTRDGKKVFCQVGARRIFNLDALYKSDKPIFIVESEIDAMSIIDVGGEAIGLGGIGMIRSLLSIIENQHPTQPLILSLDSDPRGRDGQKRIAYELDVMGIFYQEISINSGCKDANEALMKDRDAFAKEVDAAINAAQLAQAEAMDSGSEELRREMVSYSLDGFIRRIESDAKNRVYNTGFSNLDEALDGGLYAGLYVVGAISSLGKTTFCLQLADQLARHGHPILIFSLEMARDELIAKSISRLTFIFAENRKHAKTTRGILSWNRYPNHSKEETSLRNNALMEYRTFGEKIFITEGIGNVRVENIRAKVKSYYQATGIAPIVLIDYLQIITPDNPSANDKQNTDHAVLELKRLSRDFNIPVIGISSFNRENYLKPVNLASFKESGAIEYSSDVLIGLQYDGMDYCKEDRGDNSRENRIRQLRKDNEERARNGDFQKVQLKILKNRNGSRGDIKLYFFPMFNCFSESENPHAQLTMDDDGLFSKD